MRLYQVKPTFLYPFVRQFLVDEICERIVRELEKRNWQVPGITVEFDVYGSGEQKLKVVRKISGQDFILYFSRAQRTMDGDRWNDTAAIHQLIVPGHDISLYSDFSGPTYYRYVGKSWKRDREAFLHGSKVNAKLHGEPRIFLEYKGQARGSMLVHTNDIGRQYDLSKGDNRAFVTNDILREIESWLEKNVLEVILAQPEQEVTPWQMPELTPYPEDKIGPLYSYGDWRTVQRILQGQRDPASLAPNERYVYIGNGRRLVSLGVHNDGTIPEIAYDGFIWCAVGEITSDVDIEDLPQEIGWFYRWPEHNFVVRITPKHADCVYIIDMAPGEAYRQEQFKSTDRLSDAQLAEYYRSVGRTIVPITEYRGGFEKPIVLINRELDFDEVEIVSGPVEEVKKYLSV